MPCSKCKKTGHNKRTCPLIKSPHLHFVSQEFKKLLDRIEKEKEEKMRLEIVNAELQQQLIDQDERSHRRMGDLVMTRLKYRGSLLIFDQCNIKNSAAEPETTPFECVVCYDTKTSGIQCSNNHKLCTTCASNHLWHSSQTCPCCREIYHGKTIDEMARLSGLELTERQDEETGNIINGVSVSAIVPASFIR